MLYDNLFWGLCSPCYPPNIGLACTYTWIQISSFLTIINTGISSIFIVLYIVPMFVFHEYLLSNGNNFRFKLLPVCYVAHESTSSHQFS